MSTEWEEITRDLLDPPGRKESLDFLTDDLRLPNPLQRSTPAARTPTERIQRPRSVRPVVIANRQIQERARPPSDPIIPVLRQAQIQAQRSARAASILAVRPEATSAKAWWLAFLAASLIAAFFVRLAALR
jgi:hypothetical protein